MKILKLWLPVLLWAAIIYSFSASPSAPIEPTSTINIIIRKLAHMAEYGFLFYLLGRALRRRTNLPLAFSLALFYAFTDETHQLFTPDRSGRISDIILYDSVGMIITWIILTYRPKLLDIYV